MSASKGDLAIGTSTDPSNDHRCPQSSPSTYLGAGKRRRCEFEDSTSRLEPSTKRRHLYSSPPFLPVDTSLNTVQIAIAEQLPSPEVTNSSEGHQHPSVSSHLNATTSTERLQEFDSNPSLSRKPAIEPCGVANPISEESWVGLESEAQDWQIRGWVLGTESSEEDDPQPPPIEPYPDPDLTALGRMPSVKRKSSQESLVWRGPGEYRFCRREIQFLQQSCFSHPPGARKSDYFRKSSKIYTLLLLLLTIPVRSP